MTISTEDTVVVSTVTLDVAIPIPFPVHAREELRVYDHTGALALLNVDYEVTLAPPAFAGANVIPKAGLVTKAAGQSVVILRVLPLTQPTPVFSINKILEIELQKALDRTAMRDAQLDEKIERGVLRPVSESDDPVWVLPSRTARANKALGFDENGNLLPIGQISSLVELEGALADIAQAVTDASGSADDAAASSAAAAGSAGAAAGSANSATLSANNAAGSAADAVQTLEDIQSFVAGLGSFTRRKFSGFAPGQTVLPIPAGFSDATTMMVFFDSALLDLGTEYTAVSPNITLSAPIDNVLQEVTLIEFLAVSVTDAAIKTQNLADLVDKKAARLNMELTKVQNLLDANATIVPGTRVVYTTAVFTAARAFAMPSASAYNAGETIDIIDLAAAISGANSLTLNRTGADTINGATNVVLSTQRGGLRLASDGVSKWSFAVPAPPVASNGTLVGETKEWNGPRLPALYRWEDGAAVSRTIFSDLLNAITLVSTGSTTAASATISFVSEDLRFMGLIGAKIEGAGIGAGRTIASITANTIVLDASTGNTTVAGTSFRIFPHGAGDGATTFNLPDSRGRAAIGRDDMGGTAAGRVTSTGTGSSGVDATILGAAGGVDRHAITLAELAVHGHTTNDPGHVHNDGGGSGAAGSGQIPLGQNANSYIQVGKAAAATGVTINNSGSGSAHRNVQPSIVKNKIIFVGA